MRRSLACLLACVLVLTAVPGFAQDRKPNVVLIFVDDLGYGDLGCFGNQKHRTPNIDSLARTGTRFTDFYVSQPVCTASRASLLTGCYANRVGMHGALNPTSKEGIHGRELLLSQIFKRQGYRTALFGKWHLGNHARFGPLQRGFDQFFGIPYSNDCSNQYHPTVRTYPPLPLFEGDRVIAEEPDQSQFTQQITRRAVDFIAANRDRPFFLYLPQIMPHVPIFASEKFQGKSAGGRYGDVVEELDWSVGEVLAALEKQGLVENTLVIFTSDNGPFLSYGSHAGSAGPLRGGKLSTFEGGVRVPCLMRWPGRVPAGKTCREVCATLDFVPTFAKLLGEKLPEHPIDGKDLLPVMEGRGRSPHEALFFYAGTELHSVRSGPWKLHLPHPFLEVNGPTRTDGKPAGFDRLTPADLSKSGLEGIASRHGYRLNQIGLSLYNLDDDLGETTDVRHRHPDVVQHLQRLVARAREDLGDSLTGVQGKGLRPADRE